MDGLARIAGVIEATVEAGGKTYTLTTPTLAAWAHAERELIKRTPDPLRHALNLAGQVPREQWSAYWEQAQREAYRRSRLSAEELSRLGMTEQVVLSWLVALYGRHREELGTYDAVEQWVLAHFGHVPLADQVAFLQPVLEGFAKNSSGPAQGRETKPASG